MKTQLIRLQIILILIVVFSPLLFLGVKRFQPQIDLLQLDYQRSRTTYPPIAPLSTSGNKVVDSEGNQVILRGINLISTNWNPSYLSWNAQAIDIAKKDWNINVVRTRIYQNEFEANPAAFFLKMEEQIFEPARRNGLHIIIHPWFGENRSLPDREGIKMWLAFAKRYKDDPHFIYDLFAEPRDIPFSDLESSYLTLIPQIRAVSPDSLIMVTGLDWGRDINAWLDKPLNYQNIVYRANPYNKTGEFESFVGRIAEQYPIFFGEFGTQDKLSMTLSDVESLLGYADELGIGWTAWHFTSTGCPCLLSEESSFTPNQYGALVKSSLLGQTYSYPLPRFDYNPDRLYVYSDFLESGFADYSWGITNVLGPKLQTNFHNHSGLFLNTSRRLTPRDYQSFNLTFETLDPTHFVLRFKSWDEKLSNSIALNNGLNSIPTTQINLDTVSGIIIETNTPTDSPIPVTIDDIYFQK